MNEGDKRYIECKCGSDRFWVSVTDKNPVEGTCCNCREIVSFGSGSAPVYGVVKKMQIKEMPEGMR